MKACRWCGTDLRQLTVGDWTQCQHCDFICKGAAQGCELCERMANRS